MNNLQFLLLKIGEEAKEIGLVADKTIQFGLDSDNNGELALTNKEHLFKELNDLLAIVEMLNEECNLGFVRDQDAIENKKQKVKYYRGVSQKLGNINLN